ncbi:PaaI family thioesterase [Nocardiopsis salina]|uniref:PaaI family thioesterase n=1 Tax=Nocardiopsis salina TaxID=245836 RepID=UPI00034A2945|nr:PaaI family thioesterase [Nocardiopsis salina]
MGYTSVEIKVGYLRPVFAGTPLYTRGWVVKPGRRTAFAEAEIRDDGGKAVATASSSCLVFEL